MFNSPKLAQGLRCWQTSSLRLWRFREVLRMPRKSKTLPNVFACLHFMRYC
jgi:hypothetical protein